MNGVFTARSLAKLYATLANGGEIDGVRLMSRTAVQHMMEIQNRDRGHVIPIPMHWRLGFHRVFALGVNTRTSFGHFGLGGSGGWADPVRGLSVGLVLNSGIGSPFGDTRLVNLSSAIIKCAEKRYLLANQEDIRGIGPFFPRERRMTGYDSARKLVSGVLPRRRRTDEALV
jgi:CubicO group peptidase (beta-lactamase class C family)